MIVTHTRWMTATDLARQIGVDIDDVLEAYKLEEPCVHWHVRRRLVRSNEFFEDEEYIYRGVPLEEGEQSQSPVTDKPQAKKRSRVPDAPTETEPSTPQIEVTAKKADMYAWMRQADLAVALGCATKTVRNSWSAGKRVKGHNIERRRIEVGEDFGSVLFVFRAIENPASKPVENTTPKPVAATPIMDGFVPLKELASQMGVEIRRLRSGIMGGTYKGRTVERRPVVPGEHQDKRLKYVYRIGEASAPQETSEQGEEHAWMSVPALAEHLGVTVSAIHGAWRQNSKVRGFRLERRDATEEEKLGRRIRFVFRTLPPAPLQQSEWMGISEISEALNVARHSIYNSVKSGRIEKRAREQGDLAPKNARFVFRHLEPAASNSKKSSVDIQEKPNVDVEQVANVVIDAPFPAVNLEVEATEGLPTVPQTSEVQESSLDRSHELVHQAATYCLDKPEHATAVFSFLKFQMSGS